MVGTVCRYRFASRVAARLIARNGSARGKQFRGRINWYERRCDMRLRSANREQPFVNKFRSHGDFGGGYLACQPRPRE